MRSNVLLFKKLRLHPFFFLICDAKIMGRRWHAVDAIQVIGGVFDSGIHLVDHLGEVSYRVSVARLLMLMLMMAELRGAAAMCCQGSGEAS